MSLPRPSAGQIVGSPTQGHRGGRRPGAERPRIGPAATQVFACAGPASDSERQQYTWDHFYNLCAAQVTSLQQLVNGLNGNQPQKDNARDAASAQLEAGADTVLGASCTVTYDGGNTLQSLTCKNGPSGVPTVLY